jgi:ACS family hexuronate transporter-like MFS transporter
MAQTKTKIGNYRWRILALLFVATTINYLDRAKISALAPTLQYKVFDWSDAEFGYINFAFKLAYAIGMLVMGSIIDKLGTRKGFTMSIGIWSVFGILHAAVTKGMGWIGFAAARFGLGFGESGNFPASNKTVAEWFPKKDRAFAFGILNAGSNVGAILAPLIIMLIVMDDGTGWQFVFWVTGILAAIWVIFWLKTYKPPEKHPKLSKPELDYILSDSEEYNKVAQSEKKISWWRLLGKRQTWAFAIAKTTDAVWWFYLFWVGKFFFDTFGLNIKSIGLQLVIIYIIADFGSIMGGWLSSYFIRIGWPVNKARKIALLICATFILPVMFSTKINTKFAVNDKAIEGLKTEMVRIKRGEDKVYVPEDVIGKLDVLRSNEYNTAIEFKADLDKIVDAESLKYFEPAILKHTRSNNLFWIAVFLIAFAAAGHQAWSANLFTLVSDVFPKKAIASVTGIGGMVGAVAGMTADISLGTVLTASGPIGYFFAFLIAGLCYLFFLGVIHLLMPKMTPLDENLKLIKE